MKDTELTSCVIIPARLESSRLPRKMLLSATGKPLIQHTYEAACRARRPSYVCVATDHQDILGAVEAFGGRVILTGSDLTSGTDRIAQAADKLPHRDIVVNVQGDEPLVSGEAIDLTIQALAEDEAASMSTLATPIRSQSEWQSRHCVKVVCNARDQAMYFSRGPIPFPGHGVDASAGSLLIRSLRHLGIYAYRRDFLSRFASLPPSPLEQFEKLEQLRALEAGYCIAVRRVDEGTFGIDTMEDYRAFVQAQTSTS